MAWLDWLERKFGRFTIPHLIKYIVLAKATVAALSVLWQLIFPADSMGTVLPDIIDYLTLIPSKVLEGEVWRLITFVIVEGVGSPGSISFLYDILVTAISLYFYYFLGTTLENRWGSFRFNLYFLIGVLATIGGAFFIYGVFRFDFSATDSYIYETIFFAFATLFPDVVIRIFYFIPIKVKWVGLISAILLGINMLEFLAMGAWYYDLFILISLSAYFIFFIPVLIDKIVNKKRASDYQHKATYSGGYTAGTRTTTTSAESGRCNTSVKNAFHRCYICGITEKDDPDMIFRYCSECNGTYEYCSNHIHNHTHIQ